MGQANAGSSFCICAAPPDTKTDVEENPVHIQEVWKGESLAKASSAVDGSPSVPAREGGADDEVLTPTTPLGGRRRLSIVGPGADVCRTASIDFEKEDIKLLHAQPSEEILSTKGLAEVFRSEHLGSRRAVSLYSMTDTEGSRRGNFKEKCEEVICPPGREVDEAMLVDWLAELGLGWACKKGLKDGSPNQDSFSVLAVEDEFVLIGVYDGHGPYGHDISQFVRERIVKLFLTHPKCKSDVQAALTDSFLGCQAAIEKAMPGLRAMESGSTCTLAHVDLASMTLTVAHVGDARAALGMRRRPESGTSGDAEVTADELTIDHKPNLPEERKRIENADPPGRVMFDGYVNFRVFAQDGLYPGLNMSRALGDVSGHRSCGLTAEPDVRTVDLRPLLSSCSELSLMVCTDGVWEFIKTEEAFKLGPSDGGPRALVSRLCLEAYDRWIEDSGGEVTDDITAVCFHLHNAFRGRGSEAA